MKNFFLTLFVFPFFSVLTACSALLGSQMNDANTNTGPCTSDGTYAESIQQEWKTSTFTLTYSQPFCWSVETSTDSKLLLKDGDSDHFVEMSSSPITPEQEAPFVSTHTLPDGTVLNIYTNSADDHEIQIILSSL